MMIKKNKLILTVLLFVGIWGSKAQDRPDWDKIKSLKIAFLTEQLELTTKEAQDFWPIYHEYEAKKLDFHKKERSEIRKKIKGLNTLSEAEARSLLSQIIQLEDEKQKAEKAYLEKVAKSVSPKKAIQLLRSEDDFNRQLLKQFREKKGE